MKYEIEPPKLVPYGSCCGVIDNDNKVIIKPHKFYDGRLYLKDSHGLCQQCKPLMYYYCGLQEHLTTEELGQLEILLKHHEIV